MTRERDVDRGGGAVHRRHRQQRAPVAWFVRGDRPAGDDVVEPGSDVGVGVEAEHGVGLGQLRGQFVAVALGEAADGDDLLAGVGGGQDGVDRVLLRRVDEAAGVDDEDVGVGLVGELPVARTQAGSQLFGVDLVAGTAKGHQRDPARLITHLKEFSRQNV